MSTIEFLLDALDESRERLLVAIEPLDDAALLKTNAVGDRSISDILTNITAWESELVTGLMKLDQNKRPQNLLAALSDPASYDQNHYNEIKDRDLDQIFEDLQLVRIQVEDWLTVFSEQNLTNRQRYQWLNGRSLRTIIAETTYKREEKFLPTIEVFSHTWLTEESDPDASIIFLSTIDHLPQEDNENSTD